MAWEFKTNLNVLGSCQILVQAVTCGNPKALLNRNEG